MAIGKIGRYIGSALITLGAANAAKAAMVDIGWRLNDDNSNIPYLVDKTELDPAVTGSGLFETPRGSVTYADGNDVPSGYRLWFLDQGGQPVGVVTTGEGVYNFANNPLVFGDNPDTLDIDEGATMDSDIKVILQDPSNRFFASYFSTSLSMKDFEDPIPRDIIVTDTKIPESATIVLFGLGAVPLVTRRLNGYRHNSTSYGHDTVE